MAGRHDDDVYSGAAIAMIRGWARFARDQIGAAVVEFALVAPIFLMFVFLILDGGRMIFAKQSIGEVATATARCAALKATGCTNAANAKDWAISRGLTRDNLALAAANIDVVVGTTCNGVANMAKATISMSWKRGAMTLLPQSVAPSTLTSIACFPIAS
jgi:Flp pilus assembly protein TadG